MKILLLIMEMVIISVVSLFAHWVIVVRKQEVGALLKNWWNGGPPDTRERK